MHDGEMKHDTGKAPIARGFARYFPRAIAAVADVSQFGFDKYKEWGGWKKVGDAFNRYDDAHGRHDLAKQRGETIDPESGRLHLSHRAWNAMATLELYLIEEEAKRAEATLKSDLSWADNGVNAEQSAWSAEKVNRFEHLKADAHARARGENLDGSTRRETTLIGRKCTICKNTVAHPCSDTTWAGCRLAPRGYTPHNSQDQVSRERDSQPALLTPFINHGYRGYPDDAGGGT